MATQRVFLRFLTGYILLLLVPLSLGTVVTRNFVSEFEEKVVESRIGQLEQARDVITRYVEELEWRIYRIAGNTGLTRYLMGNDLTAGGERLLLKDIINDLNTILLYDSSLVSVFYVHALENNTILTPNSVYEADDFVDGKTYFRMEGYATSDWHNEVFSRYHKGRFYPAIPVTFEDFKNKNMIPFVRSLPLSYEGRLEDVTAAIVYFIGEEEFSGLLRHITLPEGGYVYIADEEDRILSSLSPEGDAQIVALPPDTTSGSFHMTSPDKDDLFVTYVVSADSGWKFVSVLPVPWVFQSVRFMQYLSYGVLLLALLLSVGISAVISWRRSETLHTLFGLLKDAGDIGGAGSDYGDLNAGVTRLVKTNDEMKQELLRQRQFVFRNFLNRLLNGYYRDEDILSRFREYLGLPGDSRKFSAVALTLVGKGKDESVYVLQELESLKTLIRNELHEEYTGELWTYESEEDLIACIFHSDAESDEGHEEAVQTALNRWVEDSQSTMSYGIHIGTGETVSSLLKIHRSWVHAREAGEYAGRTGRRLSRFADIERELDSYYYPIELEVRLLNSVRAGDREILNEVFRELRQENIGNRNLPEESVRWLLDEIRSSLRKLENRFGRGDWDEDAQQDSLEKGLNVYQERYREICNSVYDRKRSHNSELIRKIEEHLKNSYRDHNLGLSSVASEFSITESYLSYFFKEQTGENFSARIEGIRIRHAEDLLTDTELSIAEIAILVGYNSDKTFRRVFRRLKGMSPNEYRQDVRLNRIL